MGSGKEEGEGEGAKKKKKKSCNRRSSRSSSRVVVLRLEVNDPDFDLEAAVCSHGLFMTAPNRWDPNTRTFQRPLRLSPQSSPVTVRISHPNPSPLLLISVSGTDSLSPQHQQALLAQIRRMLRISEEDGRVVRDFHRIHPIAKERGFGRIFRSPTLFEDMVKCILLCNCQWSRTLSMARALCELQLELKSCSTDEDFHPKTPQHRELKSKHGELKKVVINLQNKFVENEAELAANANSGNGHGSLPKHPKRKKTNASVLASLGNSYDRSNSCQPSTLNVLDAHQMSEGTISNPSYQVGAFPTPQELAGLDENFLAKRCRLGYRAKRILSLAQGISESKIQLKELEEVCDISNPSSYDKLTQKLSDLDGFGPFTCANVLMCMGFYHRIPADSETLRHLNQFHARRCTIQTVQECVGDVYEKYAPFQYLAYWSELWNSYEKRFGKLSEMPQSDYQLITASNMKTQNYQEKKKKSL